MNTINSSRLFAYHHWANSQYFPVLLLEGVPDEAIRLYSHILNAHGIWMARVLNQKMPFAVWDVHPAEDFRRIHNLFQDQTKRLIELERNFEREISYTNSIGKKFSSSLSDILTHIVNHGTYHRGQLALLLRKAEINPVATDFIVYRRNLDKA